MLRITVTPPKGKAQALTATLRCARCATRFTAGQWRTAKGTGLRLRLDSRSPVAAERSNWGG